MSLILQKKKKTYIKENIITKLPELYSLSRNLRASNKLPAPFFKKPLCTGDLLPACKIFIERPVQSLPLALKGIPHVKYEKKTLLIMPISLLFSQHGIEFGPNFAPRPQPLFYTFSYVLAEL